MADDPITGTERTVDGVDLDATLASGSPALVGPERLDLGTRVGRYVLEGTLGAGGMGTVFSAHDPDLDRHVAIKVLHARGHRADATGGPQRLLREAQAMAKLAHPAVVTVHDVGVIGDRVFVAMERIDGKDLRRWLAAEPRPWRTIVAAFITAGTGLAAAHDAGIVHRDFKPDNVLVGDDGRICVGDFGLAAATADAPAPQRDTAASWLTTAGSLTLPGAIMGTPAYMAPEQMIGGELTPAADLFAFCVALFEALHGQRPFRGETVATLYLAITRGEIAVPWRADLPRRLRLALAAGLHPDPQARPPSMHALLADLRAVVEPRRRRWLAAAGLLAAGAIAAAAVLRAGPEPVDCDGGAAELAALAAPARLAAIERAFQGTGSVHAADTFVRVRAGIEAAALALVDARRDACEDTHVRRELSAEVLDLRGACLDGQVRDLDRLLTFLAAADRKVVDNAVMLVRDLGSPDECDPTEVLAAAARAPTASPERAELEAHLADLRRLHRAGKYEEALAGYPPVLARVRALGDPHLLARALVDESHTAYFDRRRDTHQRLAAALEAAIRAGDDRLFAEAAADQLGLIGADAAARSLWFGLGEAAIARHGGADEVRAKLLTNHGNALRKEDRLAEAIAAHREALELRRRAPGSPVLIADALYNLGADAGTLGRGVEAYELMHEAIEVYRRELGPQHPRVLGGLRNLSMLRKYEGDNAGALALVDEALALAERAGNSVEIANLLSLRGSINNWRGEPDASLADYDRALALLAADTQRTPEHQVEILTNIALSRLDLGDFAGAERALTDAIAIDADRHPPDSPSWLSVHEIRTEIAIARGDFTAAEVHHERTLSAFARSGDFHPLIRVALLGNAIEIDLHRGRIGRGLTSLAAIRSEHSAALKQALCRGLVDSFHARLLAAAGHPAEARPLAERALAIFATLGPGAERYRVPIRRWLAEHPAR